MHDLSYSRGIQVMCIASDEYMPADASSVDFKACVKAMRGKKDMDGSGTSELLDRSINSIRSAGWMGVATAGTVRERPGSSVFG